MERLKGNNVTITPTCLKGFGCKTLLIQKYFLHEYIPITKTDSDGVRSFYIEPFAGTCAMFFNVQPRWAILNDLNHDIFNFWITIKDHYQEFINKLEYTWIGDEWIQYYQEMEERGDLIAKAMRFYIQNRGGIIGDHAVVFHKNIQFWKAIMDKCRLLIRNKDYIEFFDELFNFVNYTKPIVYEDPPYKDTEYVYRNTNQKPFDHTQLFQLNTKLIEINPRTEIFISYQDHPEIRTLYKDWYIKELPFKNRTIDRQEVIELFISNVPFKKYRKNATMFQEKKSLTMNDIIKKQQKIH